MRAGHWTMLSASQRAWPRQRGSTLPMACQRASPATALYSWSAEFVIPDLLGRKPTLRDQRLERAIDHRRRTRHIGDNIVVALCQRLSGDLMNKPARKPNRTHALVPG